MDKISLISLVIDYEVPPSKILQAIVEGQLHSIVLHNPPRSLSDIYFHREQALNLFWAFELKQRAAAEKADLVRRFNRFDAISAGIISAVAATALTSTASEILTQAYSDPSQRPRGDPPEFSLPLQKPFNQFQISKASYWYRIELRPWAGDRFYLIASSAGNPMQLSSTPHDYLATRVCIDHGKGWWSFYSASRGFGEVLVENAHNVDRGRPVLEISNTRADAAEADFSIWHARGDPPDGWSCFSELVDWSDAIASQ